MTSRRSFPILYFFFYLCLASPCFGQDTNKVIDVSVTGLDDTLLKNVLSSLSLVAQQNNEAMTENMVRRSYYQADDEIKKALEPFGYYSPTIQKEIHQEGEIWYVEIHVAPGEPIKMIEVDVRITGAGKDDKKLREIITQFQFPLSQGDILNHQLYEKGKKELSSKAIAAGYRDTAFRKNIVEVDRLNRVARIFLILDTGPQYLFGQTTFEIDFLSKKLLYRMLPYAEGDPYSPRKIIQLRQLFSNSGYFSNVSVKTANPAPGSLDVPISVSFSPKNPNKYGFGIGYGTDTGIRGSLEWSNRRVNRYGHQFNLRLQPSERKSSYGLVYTIPIYDPLKDRLSLLGKWEKEIYDNTETESRRTSVGYDHIGQKGEYSVYLEFLDEDYEVGRETGHATLLNPGLKSTWRITDNRLKTKNGARFTFNLTGTSEDISFSDTSFLQGSLSSKGILTLFEQWRMIGRFRIGSTLVDNIWDLPPSLRFYAGGDQSVRGYAYKSIGPTDPFGNVVGGKNLFTYSLEIERKLFGSWSAALFFDSGDAPNSFDDLNMRNGAGFGIRWNAPFGQVRLDIANAVSENNNSWRIHFNVGADL